MGNTVDVCKRFPIYDYCDENAIGSQKRYFSVTFVYFTVLAVALIAQAIAKFEGLAIIGWVVLPVGLVATFVLRLISVRRWNRLWTSYRLAAERIKSLCWFFMSGVRPPGQEAWSSESAAGKADLSKRTRKIAKECLSPVRDPEQHNPGQYAVPDEMDRRRSEPLAERVNFYRRNRIEDQLAFFRRKRFAHSLRFWLSLVIAIVLGLGIVGGLAWLLKGVNQLVIVGSMLALSISTLIAAWARVSRYQDLSRSYRRMIRVLEPEQKEALGYLEEKAFVRLVEYVELGFAEENLVWHALTLQTQLPIKGKILA